MTESQRLLGHVAEVAWQRDWKALRLVRKDRPADHVLQTIAWPNNDAWLFGGGKETMPDLVRRLEPLAGVRHSGLAFLHHVSIKRVRERYSF
jgi:hypothetical protein